MSEKEGGGEAFEHRLQRARSRQGLDPVPDAASGGTGGSSPFGVGLKVGIELVSALLVAVAIGWALDRWLHTRPVFLGIFVLLGGAAGVLNLWRSFGPPRDGKGPRRWP